VMRKFVKLPSLKPELSAELVKAFEGKKNIPIAPTEKSTGKVAVEITNLTNGKTLNTNLVVVGGVQLPTVKVWRLEIGKGSNPADWLQIGTGNTNVSNAALGEIKVSEFEGGVYTVRLVAEGGTSGPLSTQVTINISPPPGSGTPTPTNGATPTPVQTQTPVEAD
jgi:hypothetical protein